MQLARLCVPLAADLAKTSLANSAAPVFAIGVLPLTQLHVSGRLPLLAITRTLVHKEEHSLVERMDDNKNALACFALL